jgi:hypothetical protein
MAVMANGATKPGEPPGMLVERPDRASAGFWADNGRRFWPEALRRYGGCGHVRTRAIKARISWLAMMRSR